MAVPSLQSFMQAIEKAGLPQGDPKAMRQAQNLARFPVSEAVYGSDTRTPGLVDERAQKIQKLAEMDKRLTSLYGEGGQFQSENPFNKESALNTLYGVEGQNIGATDQEIAQTQKDLESEVNDTLQFYSDLITEATNAQKGSGSSTGGLDIEQILAQELGENTDISDNEIESLLEELNLNQ